MINLHSSSGTERAVREGPGILDTIGNTPVIKLNGLNTGCCELFLKLENRNPGGSIKDRVGRAMIEDAERRGLLRRGMTIVEGTSGNTGIALALVGSMRGYKVKLVVPDRISKEKIRICQALGAEVVLTRSDVKCGDPGHFKNLAAKIGSESGNYHTDQFTNQANAEAHYRTTGPELLRDLGVVDAVICGVGSGGTLTGLSAFFAERSPRTRIVLADPVGSIVDQVRCREEEVKFSRYQVEGVGSDFMPPLANLSRVSKAFRIPDVESFEVCRTVASTNGILPGTSSGVLIAAALRYCREQEQPMRVVTFVCDAGERYHAKIYGQSSAGPRITSA